MEPLHHRVPHGESINVFGADTGSLVFVFLECCAFATSLQQQAGHILHGEPPHLRVGSASSDLHKCFAKAVIKLLWVPLSEGL